MDSGDLALLAEAPAHLRAWRPGRDGDGGARDVLLELAERRRES